MSPNTIAPEWTGETAFIVGGGPSVLSQPIDRLRGRRVIAINTSYRLCPFADFLFFADRRWQRTHEAALKSFAGRVVTVQSDPSPFIRLRKVDQQPIRLSANPEQIAMRRTSFTGAINLAVHLGVNRIVLLGADGKYGPEGQRNHHAPHPFRHMEGCWSAQRDELAGIAPDLESRGIELLNASPGSAFDVWPIIELQQAFYD